MAEKTYAEKLRDPRWQKKRLEILERDNWTCQFCGAKDKTLHVHHLIYVSCDPWDIESSLLKTLCEDCHELEGIFREDAERKLLYALKIIGINATAVFSLGYLAEQIYPKRQQPFLKDIETILQLLQKEFNEMV